MANNDLSKQICLHIETFQVARCEMTTWRFARFCVAFFYELHNLDFFSFARWIREPYLLEER